MFIRSFFRSMPVLQTPRLELVIDGETTGSLLYSYKVTAVSCQHSGKMQGQVLWLDCVALGFGKDCQGLKKHSRGGGAGCYRKARRWLLMASGTFSYMYYSIGMNAGTIICVAIRQHGGVAWSF